MRKRFMPALLIAVLMAVGCDMFKSQNPLSPTDVSGSGGNNSSPQTLKAWRPCVGVQTPGFEGSPEFEIQMDAVRRLQTAGRMDWIRLGYVGLGGEGKDYAVRANSMGLKVFAIITLEQLQTGQSCC